MTMDEKYFKETFHFSSDTGIPYYMQLASYFKIQIQAEVLKPGDPMIAENELCAILGVSRTTVRQALNCLVDEGLIVRHRGKGSFVADKKLTRPINHLYNFTENMKNLGYTPTSEVLTKEVTDKLPDKIANALRFPAGQQKAFHLVRIRCADKEPLLVEDTYIPYYLCEGIEKYDFSNGSLYNILSNEYHLELYHANESIEAIVVNKKNAALLNCKPGIAGYKICRLSNLQSGFIYEYTTSTTRADRCVFQLDLYNNTNGNKNNMNFQRQLNI